ncbi:fumarylacetoacetate hydrolase family protein [Actinokineospora bangkokensis]|uniref:Fumarylacetoacetate hydrolase n=1 Tax=Actinokineospora bangkokensis TaxID=1193682 RepID=A0A1Q9LQV2_9PSEU|nr:fumarylacetoacetate hydrolase family protein [Actinokineospora bangkokensis]OLR94427.1 fumarylacetoacetate hydrolase [Actinokineospora bangkokensis]
MVIHLARYRHAGEVRWATVTDGGLSPLTGSYASTADLIRDGVDDWRSAVGGPTRLPIGSVELLSPVTTPCRVLCQGANYRQHAIESGMDPDARPFNLFFDKTDASVTGPDAPVTRPAHVRLLDHEVELALVLRKHVNHAETVTAENLHEYVFGVTIANDLSARDVQLPQGQFLKGKSYRGFCPVGPYLAVPEPEEFPLLDDLELSLAVNGEPRQHDSTRNMLYRPAETLTELTTFCDLSPGDLLLTGTPHGCTATTPPALVRRLATALLPEDVLWRMFTRTNLRKPYLKPGDVVTAGIRSPDGSIDLGRQRTTITAP